MKNSIRNPTRLSSLCDDVTVGFVGSMSHLFSEKGVPLLRGQNVRPGKLVLDNLKFVPTSVHDQWRKSALSGGEIVLVRVGYPGTACVIPDGLGAMNAASLVIVRPRSHELDSHYLCQLFNSEWGRSKILANQVGNAQQVLNVGAVADLLIPKPPLPEQRKIADILTTWDEALEKLDTLIEAKKRRKKALMQKLLTGKKRLPGFKGKWKRTCLGDVIEPIPRPVVKPKGTFLAAGIRSHGKGVFLKPNFKPDDIALDELFELKAGDLVINITFAWEGAAAIVPPEADGALVSHRFPTFGFRKGQAATSFFRHYIRTKRFVFDCGLASPGGAGRNRVLSKSDFLDIELLLPSIDEQEKIGTILDTADQQLTLLRNQRTALEQQKRGLMQRLLTGKLRVNL